MLLTTDIDQAVLLIAQGKQSQLLVDDLDAPLPESDEQLRDFIRTAFINLGVEVEFSGKGLHERGVVIDMDTERMQELALSPDTLRFGQTVVKHKQ